jgi:hypothetical protein
VLLCCVYFYFPYFALSVLLSRVCLSWFHSFEYHVVCGSTAFLCIVIHTGWGPFRYTLIHSLYMVHYKIYAPFFFLFFYQTGSWFVTGKTLCILADIQLELLKKNTTIS